MEQQRTQTEGAHSTSSSKQLHARRHLFYLPGNAWVLTITSATWSIGGAMANPYQSLLYYGLGASPVLIGYFAAVTSLITAIVQLIGGYVGDVWGRKRAIIVFSFLGVANNFILSIIPNVTLLIIPVLVGAVAGIYGPLFSTALTESMEPELRPKGVASYSFINNIPSVAGPYIGGLLIAHLGYVEGIRYSFIAAGIAGVIGISTRALKMTETYTPSERKSFIQFWKDLVNESSRAIFRAGRDVRLMLYYATIAAFAVGLTSSFSVLYFIQQLHFPPYLYGALVGLTSLIVMLLLFPAAKMVERFGLRRAAVYSSISVPVNQFFFTYAKDISELVTWSVVGGMGTGLQSPSLTSLQSDIVPRFMRGRIMAMFSAIPMLFSIPAQIVGGYLYTIYPVLPFALSIPIFVAAVYILSRIREPTRLER
ncbi:MAG: MFS transporter [Methanomassiliicoccales archaeon]